MNTSQLLMTCSMIGAAVGFIADTAQAADQTATGQLDEIVVTATKREEKLQDVPTAVSVVDSQKLENLGIERITDYAELVPGFSFRDNGAPGYGTVILRGLNTGSDQTSNTSAYYIDDSPMTASGSLSAGGQIMTDPDLADVERVEVLKGPQGTLYGASNLGGLIRVVTKQPDLNTPSGSVRVDWSDVANGSDGYGGRISVNVPVIDGTLAFRASAIYKHLPGWSENVGTGFNDANRGETEGGRIAVLWQPTSDLQIKASGSTEHTVTLGWNYTNALTDTQTPEFGKYRYNFAFNEGVDLRYDTGSLALDYNTGIGHVIATGSYGRNDSGIAIDYTATYGAFLPASFGNVALPAFANVRMDKYAGETRFVSNRLGNFELIAGAFATTEQTQYPVQIDVTSVPSLQPLPAPYNVFLSGTTAGTYKEYAGFGNLTYYLTDQLDLTGGVRYSTNTQNYYNPTGVTFFAPTPAVVLPELTDHDTTYLATLRWRPTANISTYVRAASGYRPGAPEASSTNLTPINPDTVWNYEVGIKGDSSDRRFSGDLAIYHIDWKDIQLNALDSKGFTLLANGGEAKVDGVELDLQARPIEQLVFGFNFAFTDSKLTSVDSAVTASTGAAVGDHLPLTPEFAGALTGDYTLPLAEGTAAQFGATVRYSGNKHSSFSESVINPDQVLPAFTTLALRTGLTFGKYQVQARIDNVSNKFGLQSAQTYKVYAGQPGTPTLLVPIHPRTYALTFGMNF